MVRGLTKPNNFQGEEFSIVWLCLHCLKPFQSAIQSFAPMVEGASRHPISAKCSRSRFNPCRMRSSAKWLTAESRSWGMAAFLVTTSSAGETTSSCARICRPTCRSASFVTLDQGLSFRTEIMKSFFRLPSSLSAFLLENFRAPYFRKYDSFLMGARTTRGTLYAYPTQGTLLDKFSIQVLKRCVK